MSDGISVQAKRNVEMLTYIRERFDDDVSEYMCDRILDAECSMIGDHEQLRNTSLFLRNWIKEHINNKFSVGWWLKDKRYAPLSVKDDDEEMKEYRRLWLNHMIAYWEEQAEV